MRLLILGGTVFLGRALTDAAVARGHAVTHVHRGRRGNDARVETIVRDRETIPFMEGVDATRTWDAAIDTSGYLPQVVGRAADALRGRVGTYAFVSSMSVYSSFTTEGFAEDAPTLPAPTPMPDTVTPELYGALKAACERAVTERFGERALIVRPGLIVGPHDPSDRFTWWPWRIARGGNFVAPGRRDKRIQLIDARDLAEWMISVLERSLMGVFQVTGPDRVLTMEELVETCQAAHDASGVAEWIPDEFLLAQGIEPWTGLPLWIPDSDVGERGFMTGSIANAMRRGLAFRPLARTVADTLAWANGRPPSHAWKAGLAPDRETALMDAWRSARR